MPFRLFVMARRYNEGAITKRRKDESEKTKAKRRGGVGIYLCTSVLN